MLRTEALAVPRGSVHRHAEAVGLYPEVRGVRGAGEVVEARRRGRAGRRHGGGGVVGRAGGEPADVPRFYVLVSAAGMYA